MGLRRWLLLLRRRASLVVGAPRRYYLLRPDGECAARFGAFLLAPTPLLVCGCWSAGGWLGCCCLRRRCCYVAMLLLRGLVPPPAASSPRAERGGLLRAAARRWPRRGHVVRDAVVRGRPLPLRARGRRGGAAGLPAATHAPATSPRGRRLPALWENPRDPSAPPLQLALRLVEARARCKTRSSGFLRVCAPRAAFPRRRAPGDPGQPPAARWSPQEHGEEESMRGTGEDPVLLNAVLTPHITHRALPGRRPRRPLGTRQSLPPAARRRRPPCGAGRRRRPAPPPPAGCPLSPGCSKAHSLCLCVFGHGAAVAPAT